jgi:hypothetical protein
LYWRLKVYSKPGDKTVSEHESISGFREKREPYGMYLNTIDDHASFCMYGALTTLALELLVQEGSVVRRVNEDKTLNRWSVSGDVIISWCLSFTYPKIDQRDLVPALLELANSYLKYLGTRSWDEINDGDVSNRCNNFGVNYCPDSDFHKIGQPATGPQFYTSSALFALASKYSWKFKIVFWLHWIIMGGWYWWFAPALWTKDRQLVYVRDMTMRALYVHKFVFGDRWWIRKPMEWIAFKTTDRRNDLWYAMLGINPIRELPAAMDGFFSQKEDFTSRMSDRMNGYYGEAIYNLAEQARMLNKR